MELEIKSYKLGDTIVEYLIDADKNVSMQIYPESKKDLRVKPWINNESPFNARARYSNGWVLGRLAYYHIVGQTVPSPGDTMKSFYLKLELVSQRLIENGKRKTVETILNCESDCMIAHRLTYIEGLGGFQVETEFTNAGGEDVTLDMLTSFSLDNLSPFQMDDGPNAYNLHRFYGGWSKEGKHICQSIEDLSLEKSWPGWPQNNGNERFGARGSYPTRRFFATAAFEDKKAGVLWGAQLAHNATWQMELTRWDDAFSMSGGLGDREFCGWKKIIKKGESFKAPIAFIATSEDDIFDVCARLTDMQKPAWEAYGEKELYTTYNEYCATWGCPTQEKMLKFCEAVKPFGIKYLVIDAGWCSAGNEQMGNGEWPIDKTIFPDMKEMNRIIRENGMIPGIWFEFEVTTTGSKMYEPEYDHMHLTNDGYVIKNWNRRSFWDFRREDVREYLYEKVIKMLKDNDFGYLKVDYNGSIGMEVDGAESGAEGLRQHLECVRDFFKKIKEEIPGIIIENCASGGHRNEPSMAAVTAFSSFSDAHEAVEIPYIAANFHNLLLPAQTLVWSVLREDDSKERLVYSLASTFLGRVCLSGDIDKLSDWQRDIIGKAMKFYSKLDNVMKNGRTKIYGNRSSSMRYPAGVQAVLRKTDDEILLVYHAFESDLMDIEIKIPEEFEPRDEFFADCIKVSDGKIHITDPKPFTAGAIILFKKRLDK
ncbi:MAG: alpha-galactosidase [Monoglobales bacterium]